MKTDTILHRSCSIHIHADQSPENPFEMWDCEPPLLTFYGGRHESLNAYQKAPESLREILHLLPAATWQRHNRVSFFKQFMADKFGVKELAGEIRRYGSTFDAVADLLAAEYGDTPSGWRSAQKWFELAEALLNFAGIPCLYEQSNGYCQGDSTLCLVVLTPDWFKESGANPENAPDICKGAIALYSAWAWGDVYGYTCEDENGDEIEDGSCWGFYGSDHEQSGLLDSARGQINYHLAARAAKTADLEAALCSAE
jgi:hypothetical protein